MKLTNTESVAWLGLDAHAKFSLLAWMDDQGRRRQHWRFPTSEPQGQDQKASWSSLLRNFVLTSLFM